MTDHKDKNHEKEQVTSEVAVEQEQEVSEDSALPDKIMELEDKLLRNIADMDNLRKRTAKELDDARKYAIASMVKDLIDTVENMHRAIESIDKAALNSDPIAKNIYDGVEMTRASMMSVLAKHGVKRISPLGEEFNHNHHQAIGQAEAEGCASGSVAQVVQAGYILEDRLLRPALVMVAK